MALSKDDIARLRSDAEKTMRLKMEQALEGHDWVVDNHTISSSRLAELAFYAELGRRVIDAWFKARRGTEMPPLDVRFDCIFAPEAK